MKYIPCKYFPLLFVIILLLFFKQFSGVVITYSNGFSNFDDSSYNIVVSSNYENEKCTLRVVGRGISDTFQTTCGLDGINTIATSHMLIYGNPKNDALSLFSNTPSTLIIIQEGKCTKKTYTKIDRKITSTSAMMENEDCMSVQKTVAEETAKEIKRWEEWGKNLTKTLNKSFPPGFPFIGDFQNKIFNDTAKVASSWKEWSKNFRKKMKQSFPPGFPFNRKSQSTEDNYSSDNDGDYNDGDDDDEDDDDDDKNDD